jgi:hypothetical protein
MSDKKAFQIRSRQKEELMKAISRSITTTLGAGVFLTMFVSQASAGCGDLSNLQFPLVNATQSMMLRLATTAATPKASRSGADAPIVGMWNVQYVAEGNSTRTPPLPDGIVVDFGYSQWHSDGTEILNSGGHSPATGNFCLGVWGQTGYLAYELNHFALSYDLTTQSLTAYANIREQLTLSPSGDSYSGTFTIDVYDTKGNHVDHIAGNVTGQRITVDTKPF